MHYLHYLYIDHDYFSPNSCLNSGACTDQVDSYTCACAAGYEGAECGTIEPKSESNLNQI